MDFLDIKHKRHFEEMMETNNTSYNDRERVALFYILASIDKFRGCPDEYYNFEKGIIKPVVHYIYQNEFFDSIFSDRELALLRLGFQLFTGRDNFKATFINTFSSLGDKWSYIALKATQLKFNIEDIEEHINTL